MSLAPPRTLTLEGLEALVRLLRSEGYEVWGPTLRDGAIVHSPLQGLHDLPAGWTAVQTPGHYRVQRRTDRALFGYAAGPQGWKPLFFVPRLRLFQLRRKDGTFVVEANATSSPKLALLGVRSCDLHALAIQDRVFLERDPRDDDYAARREGTFVVAVQCGEPGGTCFCASMGTGPGAKEGFDLALTELLEPIHRFVVDVGSERGLRLLERLPIPVEPSSEAEVEQARAVVAKAAQTMGRHVDTEGIRDHLYANLEHPRWENVAERCLSCGNCTMACPTCFCSTVEDTTDLTGDLAERWRRWDSCFTLDHSRVHGGAVHASTRSRYRQWLVHKFASWQDQFGTSGCVGCGRCITWCPPGIDVTEELSALRSTKGETAP